MVRVNTESEKAPTSLPRQELVHVPNDPTVMLSFVIL